MKTILLTCDHCEKQIKSNDQFIEIGSEKHNDFYYHNHDERHIIGNMISISNHSQLHFCNENCFTNHFFGRELKDKSQ